MCRYDWGEGDVAELAADICEILAKWEDFVDYSGCNADITTH
jgi:hypothetical protein